MFNLPNPGSNPANPFYYRTREEQRRALEEAVTVDIEFKKDADGAAAVGSETGRRGLVVSGKKVRDKVYKMTFTNNAMMNKFMDKYENKLNEEKEMDPAKHVSRSKRNPDMFCVFDKDGKEVKLFKDKSDAIEYAKKNHDALMESTPAYRKMMKRYKGSDNEKVFKMLRAKGYKVGEQDDTLVSNLLKRHRGNVKKVVDQIVKDYPGKFDVERMMMDHVEIDEASVYKRPVKVSALGGQKFHAIVQDGKIVAAGMTEKEARKTKKFGQQVRELPGAEVGQLVKESRDDFDDFDVKAAQDDRMFTAKKFIDALKKARIKHEYVRYSGTMRVAKKDLGKAQGIGKRLKADKVGIRMDVLKEDVQLDEKVMTFTFRKTEDAREFERKAFSLANSTDIMMMPGGKTGVEVSTMGPKDDKRLISLAKKMGGRVHKIVEDVQLDEMSARQHYNKMVAQGKVGRGGRLVTPIDRKRFPNREKEGLEGPFRSRKSGQVYYYDKKAGKYYDPLSDMYLQVKDVMENTATYDINEYLAEESD